MKHVFLVPALFLALLAGCEKDKDLEDRLYRSSIELTDGFCLVADEQVVLNHEDIAYYDFSAHVIYLEPSLTFSEVFGEYGVSAVYAGGKEMYKLILHPGYLSWMPQNPVVWTDPTFYPDYVIAIDKIRSYQERAEEAADEREHSRIVEALEKYGQLRQGLVCEISSIWYSSPENVEVRLELSNPDQESYYYLDPGKMGMELFHYFTNGLTIWDPSSSRYIDAEIESIQPDPWDSFDMGWMSLLEGGASVSLVISYEQFETLQPGSYDAFFTFPGMHNQVDREDLDQQDGRIWLGDIEMSGALTVQ